MYPAYPWTNSYPMHFAPNDDQPAKEIPFHMKMDPNTTLNSPYQHQPWPYYPVPHEYPGCCNHSYYGSGPYTFRPPYPHYPPPPPTLHGYGFYPPFPGAYPAYSTPPKHYSVEQPRYDYDKSNHVPHHCCGYGHQEDEKKSRIVREEPKVEKKTSESLVPVFLKDSPYPIMWVPPSGNMNTESKAKENERKSRIEREEPEVEKKTSESLIPLFLKDSPYPIMWVPPSGNVNNESKAKEIEKKSRIEREEPEVDTKTSQSLVPVFLKDSPYPIMWVPPHGNVNNESKAKENEKKSKMEREEPDKNTSESLVPLFLKDSPYPIMWVPPACNMNEESKAKDKEKRSKDPVSLKDAEPIKQGENGEGKHLPFPIFWLPSKNNEVGNETKDNNLDLMAHKLLADENKRHGSDSEAGSETRNKHVVQKVIPVKQVGGNQEKKSIETKMKSDSGEKTDNGIEEGKASPKTSKLPPVCLRIDPLPRKKKTSRSPSPPGVKDRLKSSQQQTHLPEEEEQSKGNNKTIAVSDANKVENNDLADLCENGPKGENGKVEEEKKNLSEQEAALMIQSAYRGFEVRKSQPLTKLRQIGEVTKQVVEIRNRIQDMESSSSTIRIEDKQKLIVGETIMSLLLKLDTIQGLHPIVRDVRKSVAKELVGLQERLDSLTSKKSETLIEETVSSNKQVMHLEDDTTEGKSDPDGNVTTVESGSGLSDGGAEAYNANVEPQLKLHKEESVRELNNEQPVDDVVQHKFDSVTLIKSENPIEEAMSSNKQVMHLEDDTIEEKADSDSNVTHVESGSGLSGNHEVEAKESHIGELNNEQPVDDVIRHKFDQELNQFDSTNEAMDSLANSDVEGFDIKPEQLVENNTGELYDNQIKMSVETDQPLDSIDQEKYDHVQVESNSTHEDAGLSTFVFENHEVEAIDSVDRNGEEACDTKTEQLIEQNTGELNSDKHVETEQPLDDSIQEKSDEMLVESYNDAAEVGDLSFEQQMESESQESIIELSNNLETEQPVEKENLDQTHAQFESDTENVEAGEHSNMEDIESRDVSDVDMNVEFSKEDAMKGLQEDLTVPTEEAPKADDVETFSETLMENLGETPPALPRRSHVTNDGYGKLMKDLERVPSVQPTNVGDIKLMEENEKLRVAVEELLKAGNEQLGVIRELTGKVKDLEKKLSKKNKKIKVNKCKSRGFTVHDELSDCLV